MIRRPVRRWAPSPRPGGILIELALAVAILGLVVAGGLMTAPPLLESRRQETTEVRLERAELALMAYFLANGALPCPADAEGPRPAWTPGACPVRSGTVTTASPLFSLGTLPWWTLGLMEEDSLDGWGNRLTYAVSQGMMDAAPVCDPLAVGLAPSTGAIAVLGADKNKAPPRDERAAYVVLSHGPNGLGAMTATGVRRSGGMPTSPSERANVPPASASPLLDATTGARLHAQAGTGEIDATVFDDMLRWKTPWDLLKDAGCLEQ